ncbi:hypothetical protein BC629DRAFT_1526371 [Irpex lacteus]|nr:hypothetical protein BC629DRAFT_1526371 [Irpex lacteus]
MAYEQQWGRAPYEYWKDYFHADSSIFPDELVETLGKLIVRQDDDVLYRLRELEERKQESRYLESRVKLDSDDKEKDISGSLGSKVGSSDQESSMDDKATEIDKNREGLVGLAVGDGMSVELQGVTGTEDVAKVLHLPTSDGTTPSTGSGHNAQATASVSTQAQDEVLDVCDKSWVTYHMYLLISPTGSK